MLQARSFLRLIPLTQHSPHGVQIRRTTHIWDRVQPSLWHPLTSLEQSLMEMEVMTRRVISPRSPLDVPLTQDMLLNLHHDDNEFITDLPLIKTNEVTKDTLKAAAPKYSANSPPEEEESEAVLDRKDPLTDVEGSKSYPSYISYTVTCSSIVDDSGHRVGTTRRRYEDSTGCFKATHEREIDGKKLKMVWQRSNVQDEGSHEALCTSGSLKQFETEWLKTPFGRAEDEKLVKWIKDCERSVYEALGIDYTVDETLQNFRQSEGKPQVSEVVEEIERGEAIRKMSKRQEEETTPPQYL
ncbi:hypothetical protein Plhal304r1_c111g0176241 [Plasmopara halstedii]